jgi:hypothetical protein
MTALQIGNVNVEELANNHVQYINIICWIYVNTNKIEQFQKNIN